MKYFIIISILWFSIERTEAQTLETPNSRGMIDNLKTVKPKPLAGFTLPPNFLNKTKKATVDDIPGSILMQPAKPSFKNYLDTLPRFPNTFGKIKNIKIAKPQAKFLYDNDKGKFYLLPLDNMPCLVPNTNSNMPIAKSDISDYKKIPNALLEQKLIPR